MATVAFLGTGTMGLPMARNLLQAGFSLRAWNRTAQRAEPLRSEGAEIHGDPRAAAEGADVLVTMVSDADAAHEAAAAALAGLAPGAVWIQCSTIGLDGIARCAQLAHEARIALVDAPVLGTREPAEQAQLVVLASGPDEHRERCQPIFDAVGQRTIWLGPAGHGSRCKVAVNSWIVGVVGVLAETISLTQGLGLDPACFFEAVDGGALDLPYARIKGRQMIARSFEDPAFRLALARKDADLVLQAATEAGLGLPIMEAAAERLRSAEEDGHGEEDMSATYWASAPQAAGLAPS